jgi:hypothetical protein
MASTQARNPEERYGARGKQNDFLLRRLRH